MPLGDGLDAGNALCRRFGREFLRVGLHIAGERYDALVDRDADVGRTNARLQLGSAMTSCCNWMSDFSMVLLSQRQCRAPRRVEDATPDL